MTEFYVMKGRRGGMTTAEYTYLKTFKEFCAWNPIYANLAVDYKPWGTTSILVIFKNGMYYKVKRHGFNNFVMQPVSEEDINKKYGLNK